MSAPHDDFATEPVRGLPERPPVGEELLWQGRPDSLALARDAFKITWVAGYFVALAIWRIANDAQAPSWNAANPNAARYLQKSVEQPVK